MSSTRAGSTSKGPAISSSLGSLLSLSAEERDKFLSSLSDEEAAAVLYTWEIWARPNQLEPDGEWTTWLILAGRGFGKTRTGAETVIKWARSGTYKRIALVAEDAADARDVMVEGESGIMLCSPPDFMPVYEPSKKRLTWPNGALATIYSAEDYESLRGPQHDAAWCDELCKWRYAQEAWDNLQFGLRLGQHPKQIITTTPKPIRLLKEIILRGDTRVTTGSTYENLDNLAKPFRDAVVARYEGTRIGRQELNAEILDDIPGALWSRTQIEKNRIRPLDSKTPLRLPTFASVVVAVDPSIKSDEGSDETGIVVVARGHDDRGYVLADLSMRGTPDQWGTLAVQAYDDFNADHITYESNQGGDMVKFTISACAAALKNSGKRKSDFVPMKDVHASRGKATRAEPVSALYEQDRISHIGTFAELEDQMCEFTTDFDRKSMKYSPDRVDALVWGFTDILVEGAVGSGIFNFMRQEAEAVNTKLFGGQSLSAEVYVVMLAPRGTGTVYGSLGDRYPVDNDGKVSVKEIDVPFLINSGFKRERDAA